MALVNSNEKDDFTHPSRVAYLVFIEVDEERYAEQWVISKDFEQLLDKHNPFFKFDRNDDGNTRWEDVSTNRKTGYNEIQRLTGIICGEGEIYHRYMNKKTPYKKNILFMHYFNDYMKKISIPDQIIGRIVLP